MPSSACAAGPGRRHAQGNPYPAVAAAPLTCFPLSLQTQEIAVPENLIQIRAYVRWEEAGKPNNTSPEWQKVRQALTRRLTTSPNA